MKGCALILSLFLGVQAYAQNTDSTKFEFHNDASHRTIGEDKPVNGLVPEMIIILNYERVITMPQYSIIKGNGDIIKQYTIQNKELVGEVKQIMIVETKNKDRYRKKATK